MYTSVYQRGNYLYVRDVDNGKRRKYKVDFQPTLWITSGRTNQQTDWRDLNGTPVFTIQPGTIQDCREYSKKYSEVQNVTIYESPGNVYQYIADQYPDEIQWDSNSVSVFTVDIETETEYGFPDPEHANEEILLITIKDTRHNQIITFGRRPYDNNRDDVWYRHFSSEHSMLKEFLVWWQAHYPDVVTGWNSSLFDVTYLYNRLCRILGEDLADKLSPWGSVSQREIDLGSRKAHKVQLAGIASLDYLDLYKKFTYSAQESYKLDYIAWVELGARKDPNPGATFKDFYTDHWQKFVEYNIKDVELVDKLDEKMKLMDLALTMAYDAKVLYEDIFSPVKCWDIIIYNYLNKMKIAIPPRRKDVKKVRQYEGAYVKDPLAGKHRWVVSFDLNSLYPHLIMQYNMSPETITDHHMNVTVDGLLTKKYDLTEAYNNDVTCAGNGWCFDKQTRGLLPTQMQLYYDRRVTYKRAMLKAKQDYENTKDVKYKNDISRLDNLQMAMKILLNSAYGACGNPYFRYFDMRIAEGITTSGQLSIRWIANKLNDLINKTMKTEAVDRIVLIDTDSVVLSLEDLVEKVCAGKTTVQKIQYMDKVAEEIIQPFINKSYEELALYMNAYEQKMQMKRENLVDVMISVSKKRYVMNVHNSEGVQYKEPKLKVMGLQMVKSSTPAVIRDKLRESLKTILTGTESDVQRYVSDYKVEFAKLSVEEIAFPRGVSDVAKYHDEGTIYKKATPIHVRGSLLYNHHLKRLGLQTKYPLIREGDKIKFMYLKTPNPFHEDCISFVDKLPEEFGLTQYLDYDTMFEKTFEDAVQNILDSLGWSTKQMATLEDWFNQ